MASCLQTKTDIENGIVLTLPTFEISEISAHIMTARHMLEYANSLKGYGSNLVCLLIAHHLQPIGGDKKEGK